MMNDINWWNYAVGSYCQRWGDGGMENRSYCRWLGQGGEDEGPREGHERCEPLLTADSIGRALEVTDDE
jgi:hypothetical protein